MITNQQILDLRSRLAEMGAEPQTGEKPVFSLVISMRASAQLHNSIERFYRRMQRKAVMRHRQRR
jgi:hypothetical protein